MASCLCLLVKADWLVNAANARWAQQNPGISCNVRFEEGEVFLFDHPPGRPGYIVRLDDAARVVCSNMALRFLSFIERNSDILDLSQLDDEVVRVLHEAAQEERVVVECLAFCARCRALTRLQATGEQPEITPR